MRGADVIMMLRIQRERQGRNFLPSLDEYSRYFCLTRRVLDGGEAGRRSSCTPDRSTAASRLPATSPTAPRPLIMDQVTNGVAVRMAVLFLLVNRPRARAPRRDGASEKVRR